MGISKQLLPVYNKPLIYYPISVLMQAGIRDILIITTFDDQKAFQSLLGDGSKIGLSLTYLVQDNPGGIAQAFLIAEKYIGNDQVALILGDNLFYGAGIQKEISREFVNKGARIFTYNVSNPEEYGVLNLDDYKKPISVDEKPKDPKSRLAITGLYFFDSKVTDYAHKIKPSTRGELEITSIMQIYINNQDLEYIELPAGVAWLDTGSPNSLSDAALFVRVLEERTGKKIACLEEIAYQSGWLNETQIKDRITFYGDSSYGKYLETILKG
jgi:glucose-1-phosphate thymidylyltransferase